MKELFDRPVDRRHSHSKKWHDFRGRDVISLAQDDSDFCPPQVITTALQQRLSHQVLGHSLAPDTLLQLIVQRLGQLYNWSVQPHWLRFAPGDRCGLNLLVRAVSRHGDSLLLPTPADPMLAETVRQCGAEVLPYRLSLQKSAKDYYLRWLPEWLLLQKQAAPARALLLSNPQYPTGSVYRRDELACFLEIAEQQQLWLISDESYCDLLLDDRRHVPLASLSEDAQARTLTWLSPARSFGLTGLHCGVAVISDDDVRRRFDNASRALFGDGLNTFAYAAMAAGYRGGEPWLAAQREYLQGNRELLEYQINHLRDVTLQRIEGGYLAWVDVSGLSLADPVDFFLSHGVALQDGKPFGAKGHVVLNFACSRTLLQLAMRRLAQAVSSLTKRR